MAIRVLLDHGVPQENIIFVTFVVAACGGVRVLQRTFPKVRIICGAIDPVLRESWALWDTTPQSEDGEVGTPTAKTKAEAEEEGRKVWVVEPGMGHIGKCRIHCVGYADADGSCGQGIGTICSGIYVLLALRN